MRGILIDPVAKTIKEIVIEKGLQAIYEALDVRLVTYVQLNEFNDIWMDEEGLIKDDRDERGYWSLPTIYQQSHFAGRGLILHNDEAGNSKSSLIDTDYVKKFVEWKDPPTDDEYDKLMEVTML